MRIPKPNNYDNDIAIMLLGLRHRWRGLCIHLPVPALSWVQWDPPGDVQHLAVEDDPSVLQLVVTRHLFLSYTDLCSKFV